MSLSPVSIARVSFNQRAYNLLASLRENQMGVYKSRTALSTGLRFVQPSEDPLRSSFAADLERRIERMGQVQSNLRGVNSVLTEVESAMQEALDLFEESRSIAVQAISDGTTPEERESLAVVVDSLLDQMVTVGNRRYINTYLFSGQDDGAPFEMAYSGVLYNGDGNRMQTIVEDDLTTDYFTIPGMSFFKATTAQVQGFADLNPAVTEKTLVSALNGAVGQGVQLGRIVVTVGTDRAEIDLSNAVTVGDILDRLNAELPTGLSAELSAGSIVLRQLVANQVMVEDVGGGRTAADLGLRGTFNGLLQTGVDIDPRLTTLTALADLNTGAGVNLASSVVIRNGTRSATLDFSGAKTVQDVLNTINHAEVGAWATISDDGKSINVVSRVSGVDLSIEENGGQTATALGIRSMHSGVALADLNDGAGVRTVTGDDLRIETADGTVFQVDVDGVITLQDLIDRLNASGGGAITASLTTQGNGIRLVDNTAGAGTLSVTAVNDSPAVRDLGLDEAAVGGQIAGRDVHLLRADGPFTALLELREGMLTNDRQLMMRAGERIERVLSEMQRVQGQLAAQAQVMGDRTERVETEALAAEILLSDVRDSDFTDATIRFQQYQMALQANLMTASKVMNLSLLDFLR
jgi:flagellin-like hook-associated protein FlgL